MPFHHDLIEGPLVGEIVKAFYRVYDYYGFGLLESIYAAALADEWTRMGHAVRREVRVPIAYRGTRIGHHRLPRVRLHYTPTYSSWLNQVELWFAKSERNMIARGIFTSTADLRRKLMQYLRAHNKTCQPIQWSYSNVKHRIRAPRTSVTGH